MPFVLDVGKGLLSLRLSPLKLDMGKQPRSPNDQDPGDNKAKQLKYETRPESIQNSEHDEFHPTAKEMAAALAARARLYGGAVETSTGVCVSSNLCVAMQCNMLKFLNKLMGSVFCSVLRSASGLPFVSRAGCSFK
jgi:hypothetical protein